MNIILFGYKSCGKTTLGKIVAIRLNRPFLDTDQLLEELYFKRTRKKQSFREIARELGETGFRKMESEVLDLLKNTQNSIIALGGGLILNPQNAAFLAKLGALIYLKLDKETLKKRIFSQGLPTFLDPTDPEGSFDRMYKERKPKYEAIGAFSIDMELKTQAQIVLEICALIKDLEFSHGQ